MELLFNFYYIICRFNIQMYFIIGLIRVLKLDTKNILDIDIDNKKLTIKYLNKEN